MKSRPRALPTVLEPQVVEALLLPPPPQSLVASPLAPQLRQAARRQAQKEEGSVGGLAALLRQADLDGASPNAPVLPGVLQGLKQRLATTGRG